MNEITSLKEYLIIEEQEKKIAKVIQENTERYKAIEPAIKNCSKDMKKLFGHPVCNLRSNVIDNCLYLYYNILDIEFRTTYDLDLVSKKIREKEEKRIYLKQCDIGIKCNRCKIRNAWDDNCSVNWFGEHNRVDLRFVKQILCDSIKRYCEICKKVISIEESKKKEERIDKDES